MKILDFEAVPLDLNNYKQAIELCNNYLGDGLYTEESICKLINKPNHYFYVVFDGNKPIGCFYCHLADKQIVNTLYPYIETSDYDDSDVIGIFRSIAVDRNYRKIGLAEALINYFADYLFSYKAVVVYALAWMKKDYIPASNCLNNCKFEIIKYIDKPWYNEQNLKCSACKSEHCICNGALYIRRNERK